MRYAYRKKTYIFLFTVLDRLGGVLLKPFRRAGRELPASLKSVLLIRVDHIGDVIASTAALKPLKEAFPEARVDLMTSSDGYELVKGSPWVDNIIKFDAPWFSRERRGFISGVKGFFRMRGLMRRGGYDAAVDLRGDARHIAAMFLSGLKRTISYGITGGGFLLTDEVPWAPQEHETDRNMALLAPLGVADKSGEVDIRYDERDAEEAAALLRREGVSGGYAVLHVAPGHGAKTWKKKDFAEVLRHLSANRSLAPVLVGASTDSAQVREVIGLSGSKAFDLSGKTRLGMLGPIFKGASVFIGVDSGPAHIAAATGIPTVILFSGVNDPMRWAPRGDNVRLVYPGPGMTLSDVGPGDVCRVIDEVLGSGQV